jgi:hypothetical protein
MFGYARGQQMQVEFRPEARRKSYVVDWRVQTLQENISFYMWEPAGRIRLPCPRVRSTCSR